MTSVMAVFQAHAGMFQAPGKEASIGGLSEPTQSNLNSSALDNVTNPNSTESAVGGSNQSAIVDEQVSPLPLVSLTILLQNRAGLTLNQSLHLPVTHLNENSFHLPLKVASNTSTSISVTLNWGELQQLESTCLTKNSPSGTPSCQLGEGQVDYVVVICKVSNENITSLCHHRLLLHGSSMVWRGLEEDERYAVQARATTGLRLSTVAVVNTLEDGKRLSFYLTFSVANFRQVILEKWSFYA